MKKNFFNKILLMAALAGTVSPYIAKASSIVDIYNFPSTASSPQAGLLDVNGILYGTTSLGGAYSGGTLFSYNPTTSQYTQLASVYMGSDPTNRLVDVNNILYGTTTGGGSGYGTIFSYAIGSSNTYTTNIYSFNSLTSMPTGLAYLNGVFYGTSQSGGNANYGDLYSYNLSTKTFTSIVSFGSANAGGTEAGPTSRFININGTLYAAMGNYNSSIYTGTIVSFNPTTGTVSALANLGYGVPAGNLLQVGNLLYGVTQNGGTHTDGTIYSYNMTTGATADLFNFNGTNGKEPYSGLRDINGILYGTTFIGGANNDGTVFAFNPANNSMSSLESFSGANGSNPIGQLADINNILYGSAGVSVNPNGSLYSISNIVPSVPEPGVIYIFLAAVVTVALINWHHKTKSKKNDVSTEAPIW